MVDGVLASCYPSANHDLVHIGVLPIRYFPGLMEWIFGEDNGYSAYSHIANDLGEWVFPSDNFIKMNKFKKLQGEWISPFK